MITRVKIVNHKILPDVEFKLSSPVVRVVGYNGAGKSFLLSLLSPYPNISGYGSVYPILENESGLLEIDMLHNGKLFTMITEYTPNSKGTHSAKCYLNMIDEYGKEHQLNPTGNVESYKKVIAEHLDYNKDVDLISYLNQKSCGIISATPEDRLKLFKILIREQIQHLTDYYKNVSSKYIYNSSMLKGREKEMARMKSVEVLAEMIRSEDDNLLKYREQLQEAEGRIAYLQEKVGAEKAELSRVSEFDTTELMSAKRCLSKVDKKNIDEYLRDKLKIQEDVKNLISEMISINSELSEINIQDMGMGADSIEKQLKEVKRAIMAYDDVIDIPSTVSLGMLINKLESLSEALQVNADGLYSIMSDFSADMTIDNILEKLTEDRKYLVDARNSISIKEAKDFSFAMYEYLPETEACNTCILRREFNKYVEVREKNEETYKRLEEITKSISVLDEKQDIVRGVSSHFNKYEDCMYLINNESEKIIKDACSEMYDRTRVFTSRNYIPSLVKRLKVYKTNADYINNLREQLRKLTELRSNSTSLQTLDKYDSLTKRLTYLKDEKESAEHLLKVNYDIDIEVSDKIRYMTLDEINKIIDSKYKLNSSIENLMNSIKSIEYKKDEYKVLITNTERNKVNLNRDMEATKTMSNILAGLSVKVNELHMIRAVLSKHIPVEILRGITDDIRDETNNLLTTAGIDISIDIEANDSAIVIPVTVRESVTPEAKYASSGETALLGLALNSTIKNKVNYPILKLDEIDANLDIRYAEQYITMVDAILNNTNTTQIFMISHRLTGTNLGEVLVLGDYDLEDLGDIDKSKIIKVY